jgi:hypothetical protein
LPPARAYKEGEGRHSAERIAPEAATANGRGMAKQRRTISSEEATQLGRKLGLDWTRVPLAQFRRGLEVELEHGVRDSQTNVTDDDMELTGKIAWAHLKEFPDYYARLDRMETQARADRASGSASRHHLPDRNSTKGPAAPAGGKETL